MSSDLPPDRASVAERIRGRDHPTGHDLLAIDPTGRSSERARYWRCRACGEERVRPGDFETVCPGVPSNAVVTDGGHVSDVNATEPNTATGLSVDFLTFGPGYRVHEPDGDSWVVDIEARSCKCHEHRESGKDCAHLRRADLALEERELPGPDGRYVE